MEFLSVFRIKQLATRKGYVADASGTVKGRSFVQLRDAKGNSVRADAGFDFTLPAAKRLLEELPDQPAVKRAGARATAPGARS